MQKLLDFLFSEKVISPIAIIVVSTIICKVITNVVKKFFVKEKDRFEVKKRTTVIQVVTNVFKVLIYMIAIAMILEVYGVDTKGIVASLGIAGVVLGLALQDSVKDFMSGISIIMENYYVIGDLVIINGFTGEVIALTLKSTKVKSYNGEVYIFSNRDVSEVINLSQAGAGVKIDIPTAYEEKTDKVEKVLESILEEAKKINGVSTNSEYLGMESLDASDIKYSIIIYCKSQEQWAIKRKVLKLIKEAYEQNDLKIPYNQIEVHNGKEII